MASARAKAVRLCVVGAGRWGENHVRSLDELGLLTGIADNDPSRLAELARRYPNAQTFASVDEALRADFDGYTVATPAATHFDIASAIIAQKKPVLVEKPMTLTAERARELTARARRAGVNLMVGHVLLFHPAIRKIRELLEAGELGRLQYLYSNRLNLGTVRKEENILWSFAPHDISIFQFLIGKRPVEVVSRGGMFLQPRIHDSTMTILTYPDHVVGHIFVSWLHPFKEHRLVVVGSKGMVAFDDASAGKQLLFYEKGIDWVRGEPTTREGPTEAIPYEQTMPLTAQLECFAEHVDGRPLTIADGESGADVLEILERATASLLSNSLPADSTATQESGGYFVHSSSYIDEDVVIGEGTKIWHFCHVQAGARVGSHCTIGQNVNVGARAQIGDFVKIQNNVSVYEGVVLEDYVFCGPSMVFTNVVDPRAKYPQRGSEVYQQTLVREGATIGANATIVCGNTIGRHAFVAAGAVVSNDVPDYALVLGVPATKVGWACECGERLPEPSPSAACSRCNRQYELRSGTLVCTHADSNAPRRTPTP